LNLYTRKENNFKPENQLLTMYKVHFTDKKFIKFLFLSAYFLVTVQGIAQKNNDSSFLKVGDNAPALMISEWIKGKPVSEFKTGNIYVVEFWATWCPPCLTVMPHLSKISRRYKKNVTVISVNVLENPKYPKSRAKAIIDSMGSRVKYSVGFDDNGKMETEWLNRTWEPAVPRALIIDEDGRIAWIGYPTDLNLPLKAISNHTWDIEAEAKRNEYKQQLSQLDDSIGLELGLKFHRKGSYSDYVGEPDSIFYYFDKAIERNPDLKYANRITFFYFPALIKTNMKQALIYAREATQTTNPLGPQSYSIVSGIRYMKTYFGLTAELYALGGELLETYGGNDPKNLMEAADWHWLGGNKQKAMHCMKKARKAMKKATTNHYGTFF
jgi:thiol-disulfide isomerase/thioredoxin